MELYRLALDEEHKGQGYLFKHLQKNMTNGKKNSTIINFRLKMTLWRGGGYIPLIAFEHER